MAIRHILNQNTGYLLGAEVKDVEHGGVAAGITFLKILEEIKQVRMEAADKMQ